ncbi:endothelin-converting enzyme 1-like isoform X1 [Ornithodoros turicata]|uniref:endothelin-converting enzyme 1-like isoform X1 n=1 Tax=Ornithodoros turicata TaxID=34597 RepID=UPI0031397CC5
MNDMLMIDLGYSVIQQLGRFVSRDLAETQRTAFYPDVYDHEVECFRFVTRDMSLALVVPYVKANVETTDEENIANMVYRIRVFLTRTLTASRTLDTVSKLRVTHFLGSVHDIIILPKHLRSDQQMDKLFSKVPDIEDPIFLKNWIMTLRPLRDIYLSSFAADSIYYPALDSTPRYSASSQSLLIPAGAIGFPYYSSELISAINYGGLGYSTAKELVAALLSNPEKSWLSGTLSKTYTSRAKCLGTDIASYQGRSLGSTLVSFWDLAVGSWSLHSLYEAYKNDITDHPSRLADAPQFSADQLFFISVCYSMCTTANTLNAALLCDVPLRQMREFSETFRCPWNSFMIATDTCETW